MTIDEKFSRRRLLQSALASLAAAPAVTLIAGRARAEEALSESDPAAKALAYVGDASKVDAANNPTYKRGQTCANCIQYTGAAGAANGPCTIFPGKTVKAKGWCKVWLLKPGASLG